ncbi:MAG: 4Fe-4S binding protein [bacterium]|nr:4Fe-4S binding protein [bacterium]
MKTPKIRELGEAIRALVGGPYTTKYPYEQTPMAKEFRGILKCDSEKCIGCGACIEVCPAESRKLEDDIKKENRKIIYYSDKCIFCGQCEAACPSEALKHINEFDLADVKRDSYTEVVEKALVFCEKCGKTISTKQHLLWIADKVGELAYSNPTLWIPLTRELNVVEHDKTNAYPYRSGHIVMLCPDCRREAWLHETWGY